MVRTEEEEEAMYDNPIIIGDDIEEPRALSPEVESAEDELSTRTIQYGKHFVKKSIERLMKEWLSPVYVFFNPMPCIVDVDGRRAHEFKCSTQGCTTTIRRFLDKKDARSTGNMRKHVKSCWGQDVLNPADDTKDANEVRSKIVPSVLWDGSITASFERKGKGKITYSHCQHTRTETK